MNSMDLVELKSSDVLHTSIKMQELRNMVFKALDDVAEEESSRAGKKNIKKIVKKAGGYDTFVDKVAQHFLKH